MSGAGSLSCSGLGDNTPTINPLYLTDQYAAQFREILSGHNQIFSKPFPHFSLPNFLSNTEFLGDLRLELSNIRHDRKENDLFTLNQSADLASFDAQKFPKLAQFRNLFKTDVLQWLRNVSNVDLNDEVAIASSIYHYTDLLLPHDDQCEGRKFAFILYLTPNWLETDGGHLMLFDCDGENSPVSVARMICPMENTLMMFEVSPRSWHMVAEVLSQKERLSLHGWFHSTVYNISSQTKMRTLEVRLKPDMNITYEEVLEWINPDYIDPSQQAKIQAVFEDNSEIDLFDFFPVNKYESALRELSNADFEEVGPPNKKKLGRLREYTLPADSSLHSLLRLVRSQATTLLLSQWTGLSLYSTDDSDELSSEPETKKTKIEGSERENGVECFSTVYRIGKGSYTMVDDQIVGETEELGCCLDFKLFLCASEWNDEYGGYISYIAKNEEEEMLRVSPVGNSAALVFREPGVYPFIKYVNCKAEDKQYYVISCSFYGFPSDNFPLGDDEENLGVGDGGEMKGDEAGTSGLRGGS